MLDICEEKVCRDLEDIAPMPRDHRETIDVVYIRAAANHGRVMFSLVDKNAEVNQLLPSVFEQMKQIDLSDDLGPEVREAWQKVLDGEETNVPEQVLRTAMQDASDRRRGMNAFEATMKARLTPERQPPLNLQSFIFANGIAQRISIQNLSKS